MNRRDTLKKLGITAAGAPILLSATGILEACTPSAKTESSSAVEPWFTISLAQWSLHRSFFGKSRELPYEEFKKIQREDCDRLMQGTLNPLDFASIAKKEFGIEAVEYVNQFFFNKAEDQAYLSELKTRSDNESVRNVLIMCDGEGNLGDLDTVLRKTAVENHYKWVNAAKFLGCHSIRVNAAGTGTADEVKDAAIDGLGRLSEYAASVGLNVIVENHGGYSSNGEWLSSVMSGVGKPNCGTLPDFGNFCMKAEEYNCLEEYDRYKGTKELMPFAKGVSAKTFDFDAAGNDTRTDYSRIMKIVKDAGFSGFVGVEYEGEDPDEFAGIRKTKALLEKVRTELA